jgi:histidinol dehydrogenase
VIRRIDLRDLDPGKEISRRQVRELIPRAPLTIESVSGEVAAIIDRVKNEGEIAIAHYSQKFDGICPESLQVPREMIDAAYSQLDKKVMAALELSIERIREVHQSQGDRKKVEVQTELSKGAVVKGRSIPVDRVGLYVPGGKAVYPSSVMMSVIPAQIAGVQSIAIFSPPQIENNGWPHPTILATAKILGIEEIYSIGGAVAIAAAAFGVYHDKEALIEPVDLVTGPGNIYVAAAKRALRGVIGIDSEAGPTEIAVVADKSANAGEVAADLISQAEHDVIAASILITDSERLANDVEIELARRVNKTKHRERIRQALGGIQSAIVLVPNLDRALDIANGYGAEHLEIQVEEAEKWGERVRNAGAVFLGRYTPVSLGDYSAGSNHVLPTGGCACHSSGLSVSTFLKEVNFVDYSKEALSALAETVITLANAEDLPAHGEAIAARFESE